MTFVDGKLKEANEQNLKVVATKEDVAKLTIKMAEMKAELIKWMLFSGLEAWGCYQA